MAHVDIPRPYKQKRRVAMLWILALMLGFVIVFGKPALRDDSYLAHAMDTMGLALISVAIFGRLWSTLYIGAKKNRELVTIGPYSMTRNPLYFCSISGLVGVGLLFGSAVVTLAVLVAAYVIYAYTAKREAEFLRHKFGQVYEVYATHTPLFLPDPRLYRSTEEITVSESALARTFRDCLPFLAIFPLIELAENLRTDGYLPSILYLP